MSIGSVLIANRGEIAVRIARTCSELGIHSIAVYTDVDADSAHVAAADEAHAIGSDPRAYLDVAAILGAARASGADAIHPGYGFLSENPKLPSACDEAGIVFIGPSAAVIEAMGSKISAKAIAQRAGVPIVPGRADPGLSDQDIETAVAQIGVPVLLKASAGGGGKGMRVVRDPTQLSAAIVAARREALAGFGDDALMVERFVGAPRHIEVQILGDAHGHVIALADRECSLQRRHQKVIEEAPVTSLPDALRRAIARDAVAVASAVGYVGAGTVEFLVDGAEHFFLEMNTRLQVEHPVTELVTGLDLVAWQIAVADGASVAELTGATSGVAVEARIYAEDPAHGFLPTGGRLLVCELPREGLRVDAGVRAGDEVSSHYDPMLAKVIAHGPDRAAAYRKLRAALARCTVLGVTTNIGYLTELAGDERVLANRVHTRMLDEEQPREHPLPARALLAAALDRWLPEPQAPAWIDPWSVPSGWRMGEQAWAGWRFGSAWGPHDVRLRPADGGIEARIDDEAPQVVRAHRESGAVVLGDAQGRCRVAISHDGPRVWLGIDGRTWTLHELSLLAADRVDEASAKLGPVRSPMPGTVIAIAAVAGAAVQTGDALITVEAMKMEHTLRASADGQVGAVLVAVGDRVALDQELLRWEAADA